MRDAYYKETSSFSTDADSDSPAAWSAGKHTRLLKYDESGIGGAGFDVFGGFVNKTWQPDTYISWSQNTYVYKDMDAGTQMGDIRLRLLNFDHGALLQLGMAAQNGGPTAMAGKWSTTSWTCDSSIGFCARRLM
jgi:hypothetical protein